MVVSHKTQAIFAQRPGTTPAVYVVPASLDLVLESVSAEWDGAAAAGEFLPCLAVYTQDDRLLGRFHPGASLAAGDTGEVTYAPF